MNLYYSPKLAADFCKVRCRFEKTRKYWSRCAVERCALKEKVETMSTDSAKEIPHEMKLAIDMCIQQKKIGVRYKGSRYSIRTYIQCAVADTRNTVNRFSRELVTAHKKVQRQRKNAYRENKKVNINFCTCN